MNETLLDIGLSQAELAEIRQIGNSLETGWNEASGALFASRFAEDADYTVWNGQYVKGKQQLEIGHERLFAGHYKGTHQRIELAWARRLTADVVLAQFHGGILESESWPTVKPLVVLHHKDGAWQIAAFQNSPIMNQTKVEETRQ